ncbi:MAG: hypothetical protein WBE83_12860 [Candidatus Cybelea sp.]|jgi:hypothetical protein
MKRALLTGIALALGACTSHATYGYDNLPNGYQWRAVYNRQEKAVVFYGIDPMSHDSVYVGPDGQFYIFHHSGTIEGRDLRRHWTPHDVL